MCLFAEREQAAFLVYSVNLEVATGATEAEEKNWEAVGEEVEKKGEQEEEEGEGEEVEEEEKKVEKEEMGSPFLV